MSECPLVAEPGALDARITRSSTTALRVQKALGGPESGEVSASDQF